MGRYFFSGGIMPSEDLLLHFQDDVVLEDLWRIDGAHYKRTSEAWLRSLDAHRDRVLADLEKAYGRKEAAFVVPEMEDLLHGLRRALGVPGRAGMVGGPLFVQETLTDLILAPPGAAGGP